MLRYGTMGLLMAIAALVWLNAGPGPVQGQAGGVGAVSIDMNPAGNSATSLGPRQECREALPGATIDVDVTIEGVSEANPLAAYSLALDFSGPTVTISDKEQLMIAATPGSDLLDVSEPLPQFDGTWNVDVVDINPMTAETGDGVLVRVTLEVSTDASPAVYALEIARANTIDLNNTSHLPDRINNARLAIGVSCAGSTPLPPVIPPESQTDGPTSPPGAGTPTPADGPAPGTGTSSPGDGGEPGSPSPSDGDETGSPSPDSSGSSGTATPSPDDETSNDDDGSNSGLLIAVVALVAAAVIGGGGWLAYRRYVRAK